MVLQMVSHPVAQHFRRSMFNDVDQTLMGNIFFDNSILFEQPAAVGILKPQQQHVLEFFEGFISGYLVQFAMELDFVLDLELYAN